MKKAYHRLLLPDGIVVNGPVVVETDENGSFLCWRFLRVEEPATIWCGGTYNIES
ncbi:MAG: hypothetical protein Q4F52_00320 [Bacteroidaceae bacterium]|nr:hypothetical protein [Bacteroidaceae bacterium]